jgi:hypothetical protein
VHARTLLSLFTLRKAAIFWRSRQRERRLAVARPWPYGATLAPSGSCLRRRWQCGNASGVTHG